MVVLNGTTQSLQKAISDRGLDEEVAATVSNTTINDDGCNNNNEDENESCSSAYRSCWKLTLAQANGKLWGGGAGGRGLFPFVKIMIYQ